MRRRSVALASAATLPRLPLPFTSAPITTAEENGAIPFATPTGIGETTDAVSASSEIGDGLYGSAGENTGDFDFFAFTATAGQLLDASTAGSDFDTVLELYDEDGNSSPATMMAAAAT
jgi:hypothetical protein